MRAIFVLTTVVLALALGSVAATSGNRLLISAVVIGLVPAIWGMSSVLERLTGRDMWRFTAPYPYRWMREHGETALPRPNSAEKPVEDPLESDDRSTLRLIA